MGRNLWLYPLQAKDKDDISLFLQFSKKRRFIFDLKEAYILNNFWLFTDDTT
jgi:hypothetical protein